MVRFSFMVLVCLFSLRELEVTAQDKVVTCTTNKSAPPVSSYRWPADTEVRVHFVRGLFTNEQKERLISAMDIWTSAATTAGAGVRFIYAGEVDSRVSCHGCLTVARREIHKFDRKRYAYFYPLKVETSGALVTGLIDFDFATTNPRALQAFMSHELGHGMGLWDCRSCKNNVTIMDAVPGINQDTGLIAPSVCDREVVRRVYEAERRFARNVGGAENDNRRRDLIDSE
jgi:hypothetical protein